MKTATDGTSDLRTRIDAFALSESWPPPDKVVKHYDLRGMEESSVDLRTLNLPRTEFIARFLARLPSHMKHTVTAEQLDAIVEAFGTRYYSYHQFDFRRRIRLPWGQFYIVIQAGQDRRDATGYDDDLNASAQQRLMERFRARMPPKIAATFTSEQLGAILSALGIRNNSFHRLDFRRVIRSPWGQRYYLVIQAGRDRRMATGARLDRKDPGLLDRRDQGNPR